MKILDSKPVDEAVFDPVFDPGSADAAADETGEVGNDLSLEVAVELPSREVHDFLGAKAQCAVAQ